MIRSPGAIRLLGAVIATLVVAVAAPRAAAAPAAAWHDGPCAPDDNVGITVVVDFQELGGGVNVRCTGRAVSDGADALDAAGISWQSVLRWGRGFVCKIAGKPANDPCVDTPPASAYWGYWAAPRGGSWCYSNLGVLNRRPPPGSVEGWSFSLDRQGGSAPAPRYAPPPLGAGLTANPLGRGDCDPGGSTVDTVPTTAATTRPTAGPSGPTRPGGTSPGGSSGPDGLVAGGTGAAPEGPARGGSSTTAPGRTTTTGRSTTTAAPDDGGPGQHGEEAAPSQDEAAAGGRPDGGGAGNAVDLSTDGTEQDGIPRSGVAGAVLVIGFGGAAALAFRRRRMAAAADHDAP